MISVFFENNRERISLISLIGLNGIAQFTLSFMMLAYIGASKELDLYFLGLSFPQIILSLFFFPLSGLILPKLVSDDNLEKKKLSSAYVISILLLSSLAVVFFVPIFILFEEGQANTIIAYLFLSLIPLSLTNAFSTLCYASERFKSIELSGLLANLIAIVYIYLVSEEIEINDIVIIYIVKSAIQSFLLAIHLEFSLPNKKNFNFIFSIIKKSLSLVISGSVTKAEPLIERFILSSLGEGILSVYYFTQQILTFITQIVNKSYTATMVPSISKKINSVGLMEAMNDINKVLKRTMISLLLLSLCGLVSMYSLSIFNIEFKAINAGTIDDIMFIFSFLSIHLISSLPRDFVYAVFYSLGITTYQVKVELYSFFIFNFMKFVLFKFFNIGISWFILIVCIQAVFKFGCTMKYLISERYK